jgi:hypothetical protein
VRKRFLPITALSLLIVANQSTAATASSSRTIGLVLSGWVPAMPDETPDKCPDGSQFTEQQNVEAQFPTEEARLDFARKFVQTGPTGLGGLIPVYYTRNRGPNGTDVIFHPTSMKDPLPFRQVQSKIGIGFNLDGDKDGEGTATTCKHKNFVSPDGEAGIDNQFYRLVGCGHAWRKSGSYTNVNAHDRRFKAMPFNRILMEITNVDDEKNDDHVDVAFYKGIDPLVFSPVGGATPWLSQRIDVRFPRYMGKTTGKIIDGVLTTAPIDHRIPMYQLTTAGERFIRGMRVKLKLSETGAKGLLGGYENLWEFWRMFQKSFTNDPHWSAPAFYETMMQLLDGYKDPGTGQCTAISAAYQIEAVRAFIVQPKADDPIAIEARAFQTNEQLADVAP